MNTKYNGTATNVWYFPEGALNDITKWADGEMNFHDLLEKHGCFETDEMYRDTKYIEKWLKKNGFKSIEDYGNAELYGEIIMENSDGDVWYGKLVLVEPEVPTDKDLWKSLER